MIYVLLFIIAVIIIWLLYTDYTDYNTTECFDPNENHPVSKVNYQQDPKWMGKTALDCYKQQPRDCLKYSNCGICMKDGIMQCKPGDVNGPFFEDQCNNWIFKNVYDRRIFKEEVTTVSPPWNRFLPEFEVFFPEPSSYAGLQNFIK